MENASKALIIAGAILISIVLITFGVMILGQGSEVIKGADMSETEVSTFNAKFTQYIGDNVRGSKVNSLVSTVIQNNLAQSDEGKKVKITKDDKEWVKTDTTGSARVDTGMSYKVEAVYNASGLINEIKLTEVKAKTSE